MKISVILCTFNRCQDLRKALASIAVSELPPSLPWEILVVDNNSTDCTKEVVAELSREYPGQIRYWFEPHPGKAYALNSGVREALGEILVFTDDDVIVPPTWLATLSRALDDNTWAGAGGRIVLDWPASIPRWLAIEGPNSRHPFPAFDHGPIAKELAGPPFGANMAFRRVMFSKYGGFRTDLGPSPDPDVPPHSEDTEFGARLMAAGERLRYEPAALVHHPVAGNRLRQDYFLSWWYDRGRAEVRLRHAGGLSVAVLGSIVASATRWLLSMNPSKRFYEKQILWQKVGRVAESRRGLMHISEKHQESPKFN